VKLPDSSVVSKRPASLVKCRIFDEFCFVYKWRSFDRSSSFDVTLEKGITGFIHCKLILALAGNIRPAEWFV